MEPYEDSHRDFRLPPAYLGKCTIILRCNIYRGAVARTEKSKILPTKQCRAFPQRREVKFDGWLNPDQVRVAC
ncbi:hypothetical protein BHYA_0057g00040 [Botrytis hyacinthi]|uniref:Uncharacterized protein n=1 Tax=Botrytis hyacinthi TaxID=278943 RepID=A0A4Z1H1J2_9HELO|nr:hypothetical protein BHYA_0057g00040 [Botrytis hyacinthi]